MKALKPIQLIALLMKLKKNVLTAKFQNHQQQGNKKILYPRGLLKEGVKKALKWNNKKVTNLDSISPTNIKINRQNAKLSNL